MYTGLATVVFFLHWGNCESLASLVACSCVVSCHVFMKLFYEQIKWWWSSRVSLRSFLLPQYSRVS